jgi:hypothetical protein
MCHPMWGSGVPYGVAYSGPFNVTRTMRLVLLWWISRNSVPLKGWANRCR